MLTSNRSPLFSPKNPDNAAKLQLQEEMKCMVIAGIFTAKMIIDQIKHEEKRKEEAAKLPPFDMNDPNVVTFEATLIQVPSSSIYPELLNFDSLLITRPRREAIKAGEEVVKNIREFMPEGMADSVLANAYEKFPSTYKKSCESGEKEEIAGMVSIQSISRAFTMMRELLSKLTPEMITALKAELEVALFRTMHYGDADMFNYLLDVGVNPNLINTNDFLGSYRPLSLLTYDMERCIQKTHALMKDARSGVDMSRGTFDELKQFLAARIHAYKAMVTSLLAHGADPDHAPAENIAGKLPPREVAAQMLMKNDVSLKNEDGKLSDYQLEDIAAAKSVLELIINAPKLAITQEAESTSKRMRV